MNEWQLMATAYAFNMLQALGALVMLLVCELVGAKVFQIDLKKAVDRVEQNPVAFSLFVTGHFFAACTVIAAAWSI